MAGHSKWAGIKHKKAVVDAKRGKVFTKIVKELMVSARLDVARASNSPPTFPQTISSTSPVAPISIKSGRSALPTTSW